MRSLGRTLAVGLLLAAQAAAQQTPQSGPREEDYFPPEPGFEDVVADTSEGAVSFGFGQGGGAGDFLHASGLSGGRAGEYSDDAASVFGDALLRWQDADTLLRLEGLFRTVDENEARASIDLGRRFESRLDFSRFPHRLDHDPLTNNTLPSSADILADFARPNAFDPDQIATQFIDVDPDVVALIRRMSIESTNAVHLAAGVKLEGGVRFETRKGERFARVHDNAHDPQPPCHSCHTEQVSQTIDQQTRDLWLAARIGRGRLSIEGELLKRSFDDSSEELRFNFGDPDRIDGGKNVGDFPVRRPHVFNGVNEFAAIPSSEKNMVRVQARYDAKPEHSISGHAAYARYRNKQLDAPTTHGFLRDADNARLFDTAKAYHDQNIGQGLATVVAAGGSYTGLFRQGALRLDARARYEDHATDIAPAGEMAPDLERRTASVKATATLRAASRKWKLRGSTEYWERKREAWFVPFTKRWRVRAEAELRPDRNVSAYLRYRFENTENPFSNPSDETKRPRPSEDLLFAFGATNQFLMTSLPKRAHDLRFGVRLTPNPRVSALGSVRGLVSSNDDVNLQHDSWLASASVWLAPADRTSLTGALTYQRSSLTTDVILGNGISLLPDFNAGGVDLPIQGPGGGAILLNYRIPGVPHETESLDLALSFENHGWRDRLSFSGSLHWGHHTQEYDLGTTAAQVGPEALAALADPVLLADILRRVAANPFALPTVDPANPIPESVSLPPGIGRLSALDIRQIGLSVETELVIRRPLSLVLTASYDDYRDNAEDLLSAPPSVRGSNEFYLFYGGLRFGF